MGERPRHVRRALVRAASRGALCLVLLSGCASTRQPLSLPPPTGVPSVEPRSGSDQHAVVAPPAVPGATDELAVPAVTAGPLTERSLPAASELGGQWQPYDDPGGPEIGFRGNGSWVRQRNPPDVLAGIRPVGCAAELPAANLPVPSYALEATYRGRGGAGGVAITLAFAAAEQAAGFLAGVEGQVRACGSAGTSALTIEIVPSAPRTVLDRRRDPAAPGMQGYEAVVVQGSRVGMVLLTLPSSATPPDLSALASLLRRTVIR